MANEFLSHRDPVAQQDLAACATAARTSGKYGGVLPPLVVPYLGPKAPFDLSPLDVKAWHSAPLDHGRVDGGALAVASVQLAHRVFASPPCMTLQADPGQSRGWHANSKRRALGEVWTTVAESTLRHGWLQGEHVEGTHPLALAGEP